MAQGTEESSLTPYQATLMAAFVKKLAGLGIKAQFSKLPETGPVVTTYFLTLDHSVPISKIIKKSEDFALAAGVESVTINRQGGEIAITVPNLERQLVDFKDFVHWVMTDPMPRSQNLPIVLGVTPSGEKTSIDLTEMPHILLAGSTGSGKSVFEANVLANLAVAKDPSELRLVLVDTKGMDLPLFQGLSHVEEIVKTHNQFLNTFRDCLSMVRTRLSTISAVGARNIGEYHGLGLHMPYWILLIDELADLIDQDVANRKADPETYEGEPTVRQLLKQLAQISRAAGVHIIAGTQRTSVKIIDGDIKTNFPCRISLRLPTGPDSRTILGTEGAENLLGKGDMLVQMPSTDNLKRYHGPYVNLDDIANVIVQHNQIRDTYAYQRG